MAVDYGQLIDQIGRLDARARVSVLTRSIMGREIPLITLGEGRRAVAMIACQRGDEGLTAEILLAFVQDYLTQLARRASVLEYSVERLFAERKIYVVPMLNPDGVEYALHGVEGQNPLRERLEKMNGGTDFGAWCANARGVDLSCNYAAGFLEYRKAHTPINGAPCGFGGEYPESEPETAALCRFLRFKKDELCGLLSVGIGKGELYCGCGEKMTAKVLSAGRILARMTGFRAVRPEEIAPAGGLGEWCTLQLERPAYTLKCAPTGQKTGSERSPLYERLRGALFSFAYLV